MADLFFETDAPDRAAAGRSWAPWFVLVVGVIATAVVAHQLWSAARDKDSARFEVYARQTVTTIDSRLQTYQAYISATAAYIGAAESLDAQSFAAFVNRLPLHDLHPEMQGIGFSLKVDAEHIATVEGLRRDEGAAAFRIWPVEGATDLHTILYLEPTDERNTAALGYNMFSEPVRRAAMERARDTGLPAASGRVTLVQELTDGTQPGFLVYIPVYRGGVTPPTLEGRRERLIGFAYSPFRLHTLVNSILDERARSLLAVEIFEGTTVDPGARIYPAAPRPPSQNPSETFRIDVGGRAWTLRVTSASGLEGATATQNAWFFAGAGLLTSFFLAFITWSQSRAKLAAERSASELMRSQNALRESRERLRASLLASTTGTFRIELRSRRIEMDESLLRLFGFDAPPVDISGVLTRVAPSDRSAFLAALQATRAWTSELDVEFRVVRPDGKERWLVAKGRVDQVGGEPLLIGACTDMTQDKLNELDRRYSEARLRMALKAGHMGTWEFDFLRNEVRLSDSVDALHGFDTRRTVRSIPELIDRIHPDDRDLLTVKLARAQEDGGEHYIEYRAFGPDGEVRWIAARGEVIRDAAGRPLRMLGALMDITSRKRAEEHQRMLMAELNHRVKNTLATVLSIATQSFTGRRDSREALRAFQGRIESLAAIHGVLSDTMWEGADVRDITRRTLATYLTEDPPRVEVSGPSVQLSPKRSLTLALGLHELTTNAARHGSLAHPRGRLNVAWTVAESDGEPRLELLWTERGVDPVSMPETIGFGRRLLEQGLAYELGGRCSMVFKPNGLECRISIPIRREDYAGGRNWSPEEVHA